MRVREGPVGSIHSDGAGRGGERLEGTCTQRIVVGVQYSPTSFRGVVSPLYCLELCTVWVWKDRLGVGPQPVFV